MNVALWLHMMRNTIESQEKLPCTHSAVSQEKIEAEQLLMSFSTKRQFNNFKKGQAEQIKEEPKQKKIGGI